MTKRSLFMLLCLVLVAVLLVTVGCGGGKKEPAPTTGGGSAGPAKTVLKVGTEAAYAPFEYEEGGKITGFDIELIQAIAEAAGMEAKVSHVEWDGLFPALDAGTIDVVISAMTITEDRLKEVDFSDPYFEARQIIVVKQGSTISGIKDLVGKKVGVQMNTTGHYAVEAIPGMDEKHIIPYPTTPDALMNLINGSVEAVVADEPVALNFIKHNPEMKLATVTDDFEKEYYGIAMKKNSPLLEQINQGLKKVKESGKYQEIYNKYFGK
ncbi:MAG: basic amino acid ABC transporter substrate-binding protein [Bacillota bacterium]